MAEQQVPPATEISKQQFDDLLARYSPLLEEISARKPAKSGQKTLVELDQYRYVEAPECFRLDNPKRGMRHDDVKALVDWKLRHGKFRPTLMKLVSSNDSAAVDKTIKDAAANYHKTSDVPAAVESFCKLRGVGPATGSLLLSVHDPDRVLFFSDEAFYWLCCGGKKGAIKYNKKEYAALGDNARELMGRLGVRAVDLEQVAYVAINQQEAGDLGQKSKETPGSFPKKSSPAKEPPAKRKRAPGEDKKAADVPLRRSKRSRPGVES